MGHVLCPQGDGAAPNLPGTTLHVPWVTRGPGWVLGGGVPRVGTGPHYHCQRCPWGQHGPHARACPPRCPPESPAPEEMLPSRPKNNVAGFSPPPAKDIAARAALRLLESPGMGTMPLSTGTHRGPGSPQRWQRGAHRDGDGAAWVSLCQAKALPPPVVPGHGTVSLGASSARWATAGTPT